MKYSNNSNGKVAIIISDRAAGMCQKTLGMSMVVYKYEGGGNGLSIHYGTSRIL